MPFILYFDVFVDKAGTFTWSLFPGGLPRTQITSQATMGAALR